MRTPSEIYTGIKERFNADRVAFGLEAAGVVLALGATGAAATEIATHHEQACRGYVAAGGVAVHAATGEWPSWMPPEYNPDAQAAETSQAYSAIFGSGGQQVQIPQAPTGAEFC